MDAVSEAERAVTFGIEAMEAGGGDEDLHGIGFSLLLCFKDEFGGVAEGMCIFCAKVGDFTRGLFPFWQEEKVVAKARSAVGCLEIACVEKKLEGVTFVKIWKLDAFDGFLNEYGSINPLFIPCERHIGKLFFTE